MALNAYAPVGSRFTPSTPQTPTYTPTDANAMAVAMLGEALSDVRKTGVWDSARGIGHVIANRARVGGVSPYDVVRDRSQFSFLNNKGKNYQDIKSMVESNSGEYVEALSLANQILSGEDPDLTGGAVAYHSTYDYPGYITKNGMHKPAWGWSYYDAGETVAEIGSHVYYAGDLANAWEGSKLRKVQPSVGQALLGVSPNPLDPVAPPLPRPALTAEEATAIASAWEDLGEAPATEPAPDAGLGTNVAQAQPGEFAMQNAPVVGPIALGDDYGPRVAPRTPKGTGSQNHPGIDLTRPGPGTDILGRNVMAVAPGTAHVQSSEGGYGNLVTIDHENGYQTRYGHLSGIAVEEGQQVAAGTWIGNVGSTGKSTGPHLHFEIRKDGKTLNPEPYYDAVKGTADNLPNIDVKAAQEALIARGYDLGETGADGALGPKTAAALAAAGWGDVPQTQVVAALTGQPADTGTMIAGAQPIVPEGLTAGALPDVPQVALAPEGAGDLATLPPLGEQTMTPSGVPDERIDQAFPVLDPNERIQGVPESIMPGGAPIMPPELGTPPSTFPARPEVPGMAPTMPPGGLPLARPMPYPYGEQIDVTRPILDNRDGSFSTEETMTIQDERSGKWVNVPTIYNGHRLPPELAENAYYGGVNRAVGTYDTVEQAEAAAQLRTQSIAAARAAAGAPVPGVPAGLSGASAAYGGAPAMPDIAAAVAAQSSGITGLPPPEEIARAVVPWKFNAPPAKEPAPGWMTGTLGPGQLANTIGDPVPEEPAQPFNMPGFISSAGAAEVDPNVQRSIEAALAETGHAVPAASTAPATEGPPNVPSPSVLPSTPTFEEQMAGAEARQRIETGETVAGTVPPASPDVQAAISEAAARAGVGQFTRNIPPEVPTLPIAPGQVSTGTAPAAAATGALAAPAPPVPLAATEGPPNMPDPAAATAQLPGASPGYVAPLPDARPLDLPPLDPIPRPDPYADAPLPDARPDPALPLPAPVPPAAPPVARPPMAPQPMARPPVDAAVPEARPDYAIGEQASVALPPVEETYASAIPPEAIAAANSLTGAIAPAGSGLPDNATTVQLASMQMPQTGTDWQRDWNFGDTAGDLPGVMEIPDTERFNVQTGKVPYSAQAPLLGPDYAVPPEMPDAQYAMPEQAPLDDMGKALDEYITEQENSITVPLAPDAGPGNFMGVTTPAPLQGPDPFGPQSGMLDFNAMAPLDPRTPGLTPVPHELQQVPGVTGNGTVDEDERYYANHPEERDPLAIAGGPVVLQPGMTLTPQAPGVTTVPMTPAPAKPPATTFDPAVGWKPGPAMEETAVPSQPGTIQDAAQEALERVQDEPLSLPDTTAVPKTSDVVQDSMALGGATPAPLMGDMSPFYPDTADTMGATLPEIQERIDPAPAITPQPVQTETITAEPAEVPGTFVPETPATPLTEESGTIPGAPSLPEVGTVQPAPQPQAAQPASTPATTPAATVPAQQGVSLPNLARGAALGGALGAALGPAGAIAGAVVGAGAAAARSAPTGSAGAPGGSPAGGLLSHVTGGGGAPSMPAIDPNRPAVSYYDAPSGSYRTGQVLGTPAAEAAYANRLTGGRSDSSFSQGVGVGSFRDY